MISPFADASRQRNSTVQASPGPASDPPQAIVATGIYGLEIIPRIGPSLWILGPSCRCESLDRCVEIVRGLPHEPEDPRQAIANGPVPIQVGPCFVEHFQAARRSNPSRVSDASLGGRPDLSFHMAFGWRVYGLGVMALAMVCLALGDFLPGQSVPKGFPDRTALAYAAGAFMLVAGAAVEWRRTAAWGAAALTAYYALVVVILMNGRVVLAHYAEFMAYSGGAEQLAIAAGALIVYAANAKIEAALATRLTRVGQLAFGVCALLFGGAHFFYMNFTAPLVPKWLPPAQEFWAYATGVGLIAAGVAILTGVQARLAAILLTAMLASFAVLVHARILWTDPSNHMVWAENAVNLALFGASWLVADSLARRRR